MKKNLLPLILCLLFATILQAQTPVSITDARETNADGTLAMEGAFVEVTGISIGPNFRPDGLTFSLFDVDNNIGITIFMVTGNAGYTVADGDRLTIVGEIAQYNGLAEIIPSSIAIDNSGNDVPDPEVVNTLDESTESKLVTFHNAELVDASEWGDSGSFNVTLTNGTQEIQIRVDSDTDIPGMAAPTGPFSVTGLGGQFDPETPYDEGYQLFPRSQADFVSGMVNTVEVYEGDINLYPNPASELVTLETEDDINRIAIYNMAGMLVTEINDSNSINVDQLTNGVYTISAEIDGAVWNDKLMIIK